ncbi:cytochrome P450 2F5-like [Saccostrea echinata]|uniref:cytochrome P450 2F5-like n=1 Tax=Saccostrea echinata TaxID=191078 RepID=UPI002A8129D3|nr:cytochrome P450 2F5-like [Saccostrea echinata]
MNKTLIESVTNLILSSDEIFQSYVTKCNFRAPNIFFLLLTFCVSLVYLWRKQRTNYPPGPISFPFIGNLDFFKSKSHIRVANLRELYGDIFSIKAGKWNIVVVCSQEGILEGLTDPDNNFDGRPNFTVFHNLFMGNRQRGISTADFDLKTQIKRDFVINSLNSHWNPHPDRGHLSYSVEKIVVKETLSLMCFFLNEEGAFDPAECFKFAHLHIMMTLLFEDTYDADDPITHEIYDSLEDRKEAMKIQLYNYFPFLKPFFKQQIRQVEERASLLTKFQRILLNQHKDSYNPNDLRDFVDQLLIFIEAGEDRELLDSDDMDCILLELAGGGFSSVPALLTWLMGYMAAFPDVQTQMQKEMDQVVGRKRFPTLVDQPFLPYTMAIILEVQRIVTLFPFLHPHRAVKNCLFQGYNIPKNTIMMFSVWSLHHDKKLWKNPSKFNPLRFLDSSGGLHIPEFFIPFGLGDRRCPGESLVDVEVFIFFTHIMHQLYVRPEGTTHNLESTYQQAVQPKPFKVKIISREEY